MEWKSSAVPWSVSVWRGWARPGRSCAPLLWMAVMASCAGGPVPDGEPQTNPDGPARLLYVWMGDADREAETGQLEPGHGVDTLLL
jgi:hypothetical protein